MSERRYYHGPADQQPQDCGRKHPQPLCMCVLCEIAARFANIARLQKQRELLRAVREIDDVTCPTLSSTEHPGRLNKHGAYICGPCSSGDHLGVNHGMSQHALCQCTCDGMHDKHGRRHAQSKARRRGGAER